MLESSSKRPLAHSLIALLGLALAAQLSVAVAQDAPVIGGHYAARASDTGFAGAVNSSGGYGASVPLDLPSARGGLSLPVGVVLGGSQFGAAGLGADVPLSFIRREVTIAHRRPANVADAAPQSREQLSLTFNGARTDLVATGVNDSNVASVWAARRDDAQLEVRDVGGGVLEMYDGNGLRYSFSSDGGAVGVLDNGNLHLLRDIFGPGGTNVHLDYQLGAPDLGGGSAGLSINLATVSYNFDSTGTCAKHQINLIYDDAVQLPLSFSMLNNAVLARVNKLLAVDVTARESAADSPQPCTGAMKSLRTYNFSYQADADTGQQRLNRVTMIGQEGTPERNVTLPVVTYTYGRFTDSDGTFSYQPAQAISLPLDFTNQSIGETVTTQNPDQGAAFSNTTTSMGLLDLNGDGRPDLVTATQLGFKRNIPAPLGTAFSDQGVVTNPDPQAFPQESGSAIVPVSPEAGGDLVPYGVAANRSYVGKQLIDMNGDGRMDIVDSSAEEHVWVVFLNTPDPANPNHTIWVRRTISIVPMVQRLMEAGLLLEGNQITGTPVTDPSQVKHLPLRRSFTSNVVHFHHCYQWTGFTWITALNGYPSSCAFPQFDRQSASRYGGVAEEGQTSFVEWELKDINGDGYPDLVYNASPVIAQLVGGEAPLNLLPGTPAGPFAQTDATWSPVFTGSHAVKALINVAGVHLDQATSAFSSPIVLDADEAGCGVEQWVPGAHGRSNQVCGFEDVNGDGLVDRLRTLVLQPGELTGIAHLGTGNANDPFSGPTIFLPGPIARAQRNLVPIIDDFGSHFGPPTSVCPSPFSTNRYAVQRTAGLRDLNGDGIADYILGTNEHQGDPLSGTHWTVAFGTRVGFAPPVTISPASVMELSLEFVDCAGRLNDTSVSSTTRGLYDIDGDGQPDVVEFNPGEFQVYQHVRRNAGRLIKIGTGYGASTNISYRSAKQDASTNHLLSFPEIVVSSANTTDNFQFLVGQPTLYAYGGASQFFDAAQDRWVFPGYQRKVAMQYVPEQAPNDGNATITDSYPLATFDPVMDATARYLRYRKAGRVSDVTTISGDMGPDVWALLSTDVRSDTRRIEAMHSDYSARLLPVGVTRNEYCVDMVYPYDFHSSPDNNSLDYKNTHTDSQDQCAAHGLTMQTSTASWRGTPGAALGTADTIRSAEIVQTSAGVDFDDFGRVTSSTRHTDIVTPNDFCTRTLIDYAVPPSDARVRVLNAPAQQTVQDCHESALPGVTIAKKRFVYDRLAPTANSAVYGSVTSSTVTRYDMDSRASLGDIKLFDATYDQTTGNPLTFTRTRDPDGAVKSETFSYDPFALVATNVTSVAYTNKASTMSVSVTPDPVTLNITSSTDPNGIVRGTSFDGFGRVTRSTITPLGGPEGVLSSLTYNGFELVDTNGDGIADSPSPSPAGRTIVLKAFSDAVPAGTEGTAPGRIATTFLDSLGRTTKTEAQLGADYQNKTVVFGERKFDTFGRVTFQADPRLKTESFGSAYGTTRFFQTDGTLGCATRGFINQVQRGGVADDANEAFATCFGRSFAHNQEIRNISLPDSFTDDGTGVFRKVVLDAVGRVVERRTERNGSTLEDVLFGYDVLGHMTTMERFNGPEPVHTRRHYDSLGRMTRLEEDGVAPQTRTFDSWGAVTKVQWCDDLSEAPCPTKDRRIITQYEARGRVVHREEQTAGQIVPGSVFNYHYDHSPNGIGQLDTAFWPTGELVLNYDAFGRVKSRFFADTSVTPLGQYYESHEFHDDGSEKTLHLSLPDTVFKDEKVDYAYDSAGLVNSVVYNFGGISQSLFAASGTDPIYDPFGRIVKAKYGLAQYDATYAATGRRLLTDVKVTSGDQQHSREIAFPVLHGVTPFDSLGRERQRQEFTDGSGPTALLRSYDEIGRLGASQNLQIATNTTQADRAFTYDSLGNILTQADASTGNPGSVSLSYQAPEFERFCGVAYGAAATSPPACNGAVAYDGAGNIVSMPTNANSVPGTSGTRTFEYFPSGAVRKIADGATNATFNYDPFGGLQQLTLDTIQADMRVEKYFGAFIKQRVENGTTVNTRQFPVPGATAIRHGPTTKWTWTLGEPRGTRFVVDQTGGFVQGIDYQPFGEVKNPTGPAAPGSTNYTPDQFNGGNLLQALGVVNLGARIYDPVIGRFLSSDPIISGKNRYAFGSNDPINRFDPTGMIDVTKDEIDIRTVDPELPPEQQVSQLSDGENPLLANSSPAGPPGPLPGAGERLSPNAFERGVTGSVEARSGGTGPLDACCHGVFRPLQIANQRARYQKAQDDFWGPVGDVLKTTDAAVNKAIAMVSEVPTEDLCNGDKCLGGIDRKTMQDNVRRFIAVGVQVGGAFLPELAGETGEIVQVGPGKFNYLANGQVVGRVSAVAQGPGVLRVSWIAVDKAMRGQGIATALLDKAIRSAGGPAITTVTATTNYGAVTALTRVLEDLGYRVTADADEIGVDLSGVR